ncbi:hypothetical protein KJ359_007477 [Pestalotiopsis sp. 9143b]|nr:hypothetical protein KJ359_007477 [Pestalotiopsis sp. 9143b]
MVSSSSEFTSSSLIVSYTTSSDITSSTITTTQSTVAPSSGTTSSESSTEIASTVSDTTESTSSATDTTAATCVATNTVDGGFEDGSSTSEWTRSSLASIQSNTNNAYATPYGDWFAVLYGQRLVTSTISQTLSDVSPSSTLSFSYRLWGSFILPTANCALTVSYAGTTLESVTYTYANIAAARTGWQTVTVPVDNAPSSGTLAFAWTCNLYATSTPSLTLDNVSFTKDTAC